MNSVRIRKETPRLISINSFPSINKLINKLNVAQKKNQSIDNEKQFNVNFNIFPLTVVHKALNDKKNKMVKPLIQMKGSFKSERGDKRPCLVNSQLNSKSFVLPKVSSKYESQNKLVKTRNTNKRDNVMNCSSIERLTMNSNTINTNSNNIKNIYLKSNRENLLSHLSIAQCSHLIKSIIQKGVNSPSAIDDISNAINDFLSKIDKLYDISYNYRCNEVKTHERLSAIFTIESINNAYITLIKIQIILYTLIKLAIKHLTVDEVVGLFFSNFNEIFAKLNGPLQLIYGNYLMISKELLQKVSESHRIPQSLLDKFISNYKKYKIKAAKDNFLLLSINRCTDVCLKNLKQYINHTMKYSKLKLFHSSIDSVIDLIEIKSDQFIARLALSCVIYSEYQTKKKGQYNIKENSMGEEYITSISHDDSMDLVYLPPINYSFTYSLVVDLDETLVHYIQSNNEGTYFIRPFCFDFLEELYHKYELIVFTAGTKEYADMILDKIDYKQKYFKHRLYRDHVTISQYSIIKDLSKLGRDLSKTIIIDNLEDNFTKQPNNGLLIKTWKGEMNDSELLDLIPLLSNIISLKPMDVRDVIKQINTMTRTKSGDNPYTGITINDYFV